MALNPDSNQYTGPAYDAKVCFIAVCDITTIVNKGRLVRANERSISLDVCGFVSKLDRLNYFQKISLFGRGGGKGEGSDDNDSNKSRFEYFFGAPFLNLYNFHFRICN